MGDEPRATMSGSDSGSDYSEEDLTYEDSAFYPKDETEFFDNIIGVDNLPQIPEAKKDKLLTVINKIVSKAGSINENSVVGEKGMHMPFGDDGVSLGFIYIEMAAPIAAQDAQRVLDGYALDKKHEFKCYLFSDYKQFLHTPDTYTAPVPPEFEDQGDVSSHLMDQQARDQYVIRYGNTTEVIWNDREKPIANLHEPRPDWTEKFVTWSPNGTYLLTVFERGVLLWGGPGFQRLQKFAHQGVSEVDFSPGERYLCTWSGDVTGEDENLLVWDVKTGEVQRGFSTTRTLPQWPIFHWSADQKFVMRQGDEDGSISCFKLPSMQPACKRIKYPGATSASFSPSLPIISFWIPEIDQNPARVGWSKCQPGRKYEAKSCLTWQIVDSSGILAANTFAFRWTATPRVRRLSSPISRYSASPRRTCLWKFLSSRTKCTRLHGSRSDIDSWCCTGSLLVLTSHSSRWVIQQTNALGCLYNSRSLRHSQRRG